MFYLIDRTDDRVVAGHASTEGFYTNGMRIIATPPDVPIDETNRSGGDNTFLLEDLLEEKYEGLFQKHPLFSHMEYDVFSEEPSNMTGSEARIGYGEGVLWLAPDGNMEVEFSTTPDLVDRILVQWETYTLERDIEGTASFVKYTPREPDILDVLVSNGGPEGFIPTTNEEVVGFADHEDSVFVRFENNTGSRIYLGGYGVLYRTTS